MAAPDATSDFQNSTADRNAVIADLSQWLELPVTVIRGGWQFPESFESARKAYEDETCSWHGGKETEEWYLRVRERFDNELTLAAASLRVFIAEQDKSTAEKLSDDDMRSLLRFGHATLRDASTQPVSQVIVFDPIESGAAPDRDWAIKSLIGENFADAWSKNAATGFDQMKFADFVENFDVNPLDLYAHQVLLRIRYALRHEHQLQEHKPRLDEEKQQPHSILFADKKEYGSLWEYHPYSLKIETSGSLQTRAEMKAFNYLNRYDRSGEIKDKPFGHDSRFYEKMVRLEATGSLFFVFNDAADETLRRLVDEPDSGYMHYYAKEDEQISRDGLTRDDSERIKKELMEKIMEAVRAGRPENLERGTGIARAFDFRVMAPAFRAIHEADQSKGTQRAFLNIVKEGLERYFPTLYKSPVPGWTPEDKPPQTLDEYRQRQPAQDAPPSPQPPA